MKSVVKSLGTNDFIRIRLGVGPEKVWGDLTDYVLTPMARAEREIAARMVADTVDAVEILLTEGVGKAMAKYNRRNTPPDQELN